MTFPWEVLEKIRESGGLPYLVGGAVRDSLMKGYENTGCLSVLPNIQLSDFQNSKDLDFEVFGLSLDDLQVVLTKFGEVDVIGKSFGVLKLHSMPEIDFSVPRRDNKIGTGHRGFRMEFDPKMTLDEASRRRDLTINSMAFDPFAGVVHDPHSGVFDIQNRVLRATDSDTFLEDPLRALRVAQFMSRFGYEPDFLLRKLCSAAELSELPGERIFEELKKLLLGNNPEIGLEFMKDCGLTKFFPQLHDLIDCIQDKEWHPEGSVWIHSVMAVTEARKLTNDFTLILATLCHDLGKPSTTKFEDGMIRSRGHDEAGIKPATEFLNRLRAPKEMIDKICCLILHHLDPTLYDRQGAGKKAYRRLFRDLSANNLSIEDLYIVSKADHFGRTTKDALNKSWPEGDRFLEKMKSLDLHAEAPKKYTDVVMGRHLLAKGFKQGKEIGKMISVCRELQDETGSTDPDYLISIALEMSDGV